jgi:hypothetical protein
MEVDTQTEILLARQMPLGKYKSQSHRNKSEGRYLYSAITTPVKIPERPYSNVTVKKYSDYLSKHNIPLACGELGILGFRDLTIINNQPQYMVDNPAFLLVTPDKELSLRKFHYGLSQLLSFSNNVKELDKFRTDHQEQVIKQRSLRVQEELDRHYNEFAIYIRDKSLDVLLSAQQMNLTSFHLDIKELSNYQIIELLRSLLRKYNDTMNRIYHSEQLLEMTPSSEELQIAYILGRTHESLILADFLAKIQESRQKSSRLKQEIEAHKEGLHDELDSKLSQLIFDNSIRMGANSDQHYRPFLNQNNLQICFQKDGSNELLPLIRMGGVEQYTLYNLAALLAIHEMLAANRATPFNFLFLDQFLSQSPNYLYLHSPEAANISHSNSKSYSSSLIEGLLHIAGAPSFGVQIILIEQDLPSKVIENGNIYLVGDWRFSRDGLVPYDWYGENAEK